jgi:hypothetical protein
MYLCNGRAHYETTDAYDTHSWPCPGPEKCADAARRQKEAEMPIDYIIDGAEPVPPDKELPEGVALSVHINLRMEEIGQRDQTERSSPRFTVHAGVDDVIVLERDPQQQAGLNSISLDFAALEAAVRLARKYKT